MTAPGIGGRAGAPVVRWTDLGRMPYEAAWDLQRRIVAQRKAGAGVDRLLLVEHEPVLTLGRRARAEHVLAPPAALAARGLGVHAVERAGDVTYHGPGQLVAYPILDLRGHLRDVRWYSGALLEAVLRVLGAFGLEAHARDGVETGVWLGQPGDGRHEKVAALGVRIEQWVTYHGIALNVDPDLGAFDLIVPCGLTFARATSMARALGRPLDVATVRPALVAALGAALGVEVRPDPLPWPEDGPSPDRREEQPA